MLDLRRSSVGNWEAVTEKRYSLLFLDHKTRKIAIGENCHSQKVYDIFPIWQFVQEICHTYLLLPTHLPVNYEQVKVCHGKENNCDYCGPIVKFYSV